MLETDLGDIRKTVTSNRHWPNTTAAVTWEKMISPTMTNELLLNGSRDYHWRGSGDRHTNYSSALGLPNPFGAFNWPSITDLGIGSYPFGSQAPFWLITNYALLQDNAPRFTASTSSSSVLGSGMRSSTNRRTHWLVRSVPTPWRRHCIIRPQRLRARSR
jgi:hypothetical protein